MKMVLLLIALFVMLFGGLIVERSLKLGFDLADEALEDSGKLLKFPFVVTLKLLKLAGGLILRRFKKPEVIQVTPILNVTPLHIQQMKHSGHLAHHHRQPVIIEHSPLNKN